MAVSVRIEDEAFGDLRFRRLGVLLGSNEFDALGRMAWLWRQATQQATYILSEDEVALIVDPNLVVQSKLGERVDGGIRIKGAKGRIEWLHKLRSNSKLGGAKTKDKWGQSDSQQGANMGANRGPIGPPEIGPIGSPPAPAPAPAPFKEKNEQQNEPANASGPNSGELPSDLSPAMLARQWCFVCTRRFNGRSKDDERDMTGEFANLEGLGVPAAAMLEEINRGPPQRDRGEHFWQFKDRLLERFNLKQQATGKPAKKSALDRLIEGAGTRKP